MYYVPDGTEMCGFYECEECASRFLSLKIGPKLCARIVEKNRIWRSDRMKKCRWQKRRQNWLEVVEGAENVERMDALLSLAVTGGDYEWI